MKINRQENRTNLLNIVEKQKDSGLSQVKWCKENDINIHTFRGWVHRLSQSNNDQTLVNTFVSVSPVTNRSSSFIKINIGAAIIEVDHYVDINLLDNIVKVLTRYA